MDENGIRGRFRELMSDTHFTYPRRRTICHGAEWYIDGHLRARPLFGILSMANLAENFMYRVRHGRRGQRDVMVDVARFYASTRRAMQNVLSTYPIGLRLTRKATESIALVLDRLTEEAAVTLALLEDASRLRTCPACNGSTGLSKDDSELLEAILMEQSKLGIIPKTSSLYRPSVGVATI